MTQFDSLPQILKADEFAKYLRISLSTVHRMAQSGKIFVIKDGKYGRMRFRKSDLEKIINPGLDVL